MISIKFLHETSVETNPVIHILRNPQPSYFHRCFLMREYMFNSIMSSNAKCQVCIETSKQNYIRTIIPHKYYCSTLRPTTVNSFRSRGGISTFWLAYGAKSYKLLSVGRTSFIILHSWDILTPQQPFETLWWLQRVRLLFLCVFRLP